MKPLYSYGKRALSLLLLFSALGGGTATAADFVTSDNLKYSINSDSTTVTLVGFSTAPTTATTIDISSGSVPYNGKAYTISAIKENAFNGVTNLTGTLTLPKGITLNAGAFTGTGITELTINDNITANGNGSFKNCTSLKKITFADGLREIPANLFYSASATADVEIVVPSTVTSIGDNAFHSANFPRTLDFSKISSIGASAFEKNSALQQLSHLPDRVAIGQSAFDGCSNLSGSVTLPKGATVSAYAFRNTKIEELVVNEGITVKWEQYYSLRRYYIFDGCSSLKKITFTDGTTTIPDHLFCGSQIASEATFKIPSSITEIGEGAFQDCNISQSIDFSNVSNIGLHAFDGSQLSGTVVLKKDATVGAYAFQNTKITELVINDGIKTNHEQYYYQTRYYIFNGCSSLMKITFTDGTTTIPDHLFCGSKIAERATFEIPASITNIGEGAFQNCNISQSINFSNVSNIGLHAFDGSQLSGTVVLKKDATVGAYAFQNTKITELVINDGIKTNHEQYYNQTRYYIFNGCSSLKKIIIAEGTTKIADNLFRQSGMASDVDISVPISLTEIGAGTFQDTNIPTSFDFRNIAKIGSSAFQNNTGLTGDIDLPQCLTLGEYCFYNTKLTKATLGKAENIGQRVFANCANLEQVNLPRYAKGSEPKIALGWSIIDNCPKLSSFTITNAVKSLSGNPSINGQQGGTFNAVTSPFTLNLEFDKFRCDRNIFGSLDNLTINVVPNTEATGIPASLCRKGNIYGSGPKHVELKGNVQWIGEYAFDRTLTSQGALVLPEGLESIGVGAFYQTGITELTVPSTLKIYPEAFKSCTELNTVHLNTNLVSEKAFYGCSQLKTVDEGEKVTALVIGKQAFSRCTGLTNISLEHAKFIGEEAFAGAGDVNGDVVFEDLETIENGAFWGTTINGKLIFKHSPLNIKSTWHVTLGTEVGYGTGETFGNCNITGIEFPESVTFTYDGNSEVSCAVFNNSNTTFLRLPKHTVLSSTHGPVHAFGSMPKLAKVTIPADATLTINTKNPSYLFASDKALDTAIFEDGTKTIVNFLQGCPGTLSHVFIPNTVTAIGDNAFASTTNMQTLLMPSSVMRIANNAFYQSKAAENDRLYIKADVPFGITTFSRGFGIKFNTDKSDELVIDGKKYSVWVPTSIDFTKGELVLQQYTGKNVLSTEAAPEAQASGAATDYTKQPVGFLLIQDGWQQKTPTDLNGEEATAGTGSVNMHVLLNGTYVQKGTTTFDSKNMMRGIIDPVNIKDVSDKYVISKRDLALHVMSAKGTFPAGRAYIYAPTSDSTSGSAKGFKLFYSNEPLIGTTTGIIKDITTLYSDRMADDNYYDLSGRKVNFPHEGIYIHHGRKVVIKRM